MPAWLRGDDATSLTRNHVRSLHRRCASSPCCLIVDDEPALRQVLVHLMRSDGFTCIEAGDGEEALAALARHDVTLVLSDLQMPKLDGMGLLRRDPRALARHGGSRDHRTSRTSTSR